MTVHRIIDLARARRLEEAMLRVTGDDARAVTTRNAYRDAAAHLRQGEKVPLTVVARAQGEVPGECEAADKGDLLSID